MTQIRVRSMLNQIRLTQTIDNAELRQTFHDYLEDSHIL